MVLHKNTGGRHWHATSVTQKHWGKRLFRVLTYINLAFWLVANDTAIITEAALAMQIETPPGEKDTPDGIRVTVVLVVYLWQQCGMSYSTVRSDV